jgi:hypothetical protein
MHTGAGQSWLSTDDATRHGYGMASMIKYLVKTHGEMIVRRMFEAIRTEAHVIDAVLAATGASRAADVLGETGNTDIAVAAIPGGCRAAVVNHGDRPLDIVIVPLVPEPDAGGARGVWTDLVTGKSEDGRASDAGLPVRVAAGGYVCWEFKKR